MAGAGEFAALDALSESADLAASACAGVVVCGVIVVTELMLEIAMVLKPHKQCRPTSMYGRELNEGGPMGQISKSPDSMVISVLIPRCECPN